MGTYQVKKIKNGEFQVLGPEGQMYQITGASCSCPGFQYRGVCKHLKMVPAEQRFPREFVDQIVNELKATWIDKAVRWEVAGSYRRLKKDVGDIDLLVLMDERNYNQMKLDLANNFQISIIMSGSSIFRFMYGGIQLDITRVEDEFVWSFYLLYRTGSKENNINMRARAKVLGCCLSEKGLFFNDGTRVDVWTEQAVYEFLGLQYLRLEER